MAYGGGSGFGHVNPPKKHKPQSEKRPPPKRKPSRRTFRATALKTGHFGDIALSVRGRPQNPPDISVGRFRDVALSVRSQPKTPSDTSSERFRSVAPSVEPAQQPEHLKRAALRARGLRPTRARAPSAQSPPYSAALMARDRSSKVSYAGISGCSALMVTVLRNRKPAFDALIMPRSL